MHRTFKSLQEYSAYLRRMAKECDTVLKEKENNKIKQGEENGKDQNDGK